MSPPRRPLALLPTPLQRFAGMYLKRDDLSGFGLAGAKARALEYLLGDALAHDADVLVTGGSPSSNFIGGAALAASVCGMECEVLVSGTALERAPATLHLVGCSEAKVLYTGADRAELDRLIDERAAHLRDHGRTPYAIPRGGATPVGALGFANAAEELAAQLDFDEAVVVLPVGSGASIAGLLAGRAAIAAKWQVYGVSVSRPLPEIRGEILGLVARITPEAVTDWELIDAMEAAEAADDRDVHTMLAALRADGVLFDAKYGTKALAAVARLRARADRPIVLWHTGGLPAALDLLGRAAT
ncbi:1-aminocyclopropane-1-carboxylate deaminase/D-cysteine desulfhydrase [Nonomuraea lactucae]|uniref:1-aminocyclopropane-1-carboxylate deaminase/D-cysteine desulfhydrase n=1 Tax=Nonomuraea lactucae TaxID=2249762 RepID=UPI000DE2A1AF|nr:pyridoxal-phosphate dependent enzyme [Nonomuraea lactucae]